MPTILTGDWIEKLRELPDKSHHMACTSPPYYGLRDYKVAGQLGCEATPEEYVQKLVAGFRELRRVLRDDGILWLNLGDSYARNGGNGGCGPNAIVGNTTRLVQSHNCEVPRGYKPKDLLGIPWMVAFALRADGWYLRSWMPWVKRNCMPESVTDRPATACETVFLLSKSKDCFYDSEAVKLVGAIAAGTRAAKGSAERAAENGVNARPPEYKIYDGRRNRRNSDNFWDTWQGLMSDDEGQPLALVVNTSPYKGAHFAVFPKKLVEPMIKAGTSEHGVCFECGAPYERVVEKVRGVPESFNGSSFTNGKSLEAKEEMAAVGRGERVVSTTTTTGWRKPCQCPTDFPVPAKVLDPFGGSGTTGEVCNALGRDYTLIELNPAYIPLINQRCGV